MAKFTFGVVVGSVGACGVFGVYMGIFPAFFPIVLAVVAICVVSFSHWEKE